MRTSSLLFSLLLFAGCGGDSAPDAPVGSTSAPVVDQAEPAPKGNGEGVADATRLTVVFTNNVDGEIEPCG